MYVSVKEREREREREGKRKKERAKKRDRERERERKRKKESQREIEINIERGSERVRRGVKNIDTSRLPPHVSAHRGCNYGRSLAGAIIFHLLAQPACARLGSEARSPFERRQPAHAFECHFLPPAVAG